LKKPDEGNVVEFQKPGVPPIPKIGTLTGPRVVLRCRSIGIWSRKMNGGMSMTGVPLVRPRPNGRSGTAPPGMLKPGMETDSGRPRWSGASGMVKPGMFTVAGFQENGWIDHPGEVEVTPPLLKSTILT